MTFNRALLAGAAAVIALPGMAGAQAYRCAVPGEIATPHPDLPDEREPQRLLPIGGYTLAISWSPQFCRTRMHDPKARMQCGGNRFGFVLHGLWPDGEGKDWPQYCAATDIVPRQVIAANLCSTPSAQLLQHEWAKHGTCTSMSPAAYFGTARRLYDAVRYPDMERLSRGELTVGGFKARFAEANRGIPASAIRVTVTREGWLDELWLCLDKGLRYEACRPGTGGAADGSALKIWRGGRR